MARISEVEVGKKFGRLTVLELLKKQAVSGHNLSCARCLCDCGCEKTIRVDSLGTRTLSCGCLNREIVRIKLTKREGITGKVCSKCHEWKPLDQFYPDNKSSDGKESGCKACKAAYREENAEKINEQLRNYREVNAEKLRYRRMKWNEDNRDKKKEIDRKYNSKNLDKRRLVEQRRRASVKYLPNSLYVHSTHYLTCALTGCTDVDLDHAIPIASGHGGTTRGNMYGLRSDLNKSKSNSNIFKWFSANKERFNLSQDNFDILIQYLAIANSLTVEEYRLFYDWCFDNKRSINEIKVDQRHSIEIWREAKGRQFPLPSYTEAYRHSDWIGGDDEC